jgi:hypothetical protein
MYAEQGLLQTQLITSEKIKELLSKQKLPNGLDYRNFPLPELHKIIIPNTYAHKQYLVYVLEMPLFSPATYNLYKLLPFPVKQDVMTYSYIGFVEECF